MTKEQFFTQLNKAGVWNVGATIARTNAIPLDKTSVFDSYSSASTYALESPLAYPGQVISVVNADSVETYVINPLGELQTISGGGGGSPDAHTSLGQWAYQAETDYGAWNVESNVITNKPSVCTEIALSAVKKKNNTISAEASPAGAYIYYITTFPGLTFTSSGFDAGFSQIQTIVDGAATYYVYRSNQKLTAAVNLTIY